MRAFVAIIAVGVLGCGLPAEPHQSARFRRIPTYGAPGLAQASTNFDAEFVGPFLRRIAPLIESGFGPREIGHITGLISKMPVDAEHQYDFPIVYKNKSATLHVVVFMDDIDAPDLYFFAPPTLANAIQAEMRAFATETGY